MSDIGAFWSYSRHDDPAPLQALHVALEKEVSALVGWDFRIWRDRQDIATGTNWRSEIVTGLHRSRILIAVITPRWLASPYCQEEYALFLEAEAAAQGPRTIFPISYIDWSKARAEFSSERSAVLTDLEQRQPVNWKSLRELLRAHGVEQPEVRTAIGQLAKEVRDAAIALPRSRAQRRSGSIRASCTPSAPTKVRRSRRIIPQGPPSRPDGPARIEISTGGNYSVTVDSIDLKVGTHFESVTVETDRYRFPLALQKATVQIDALQADIDSDSCFGANAKATNLPVRYRRLGEWEILNPDGMSLDGDYFPGSAACRLVNCRDDASAVARITASSRDFVIDTTNVEQMGKGFFRFSNPTKERLISIWLRERVAERLGGTRSEVVLHQAELKTEVVVSEDE